MKILFDMDGVIVDFVGGVKSIFGEPINKADHWDLWDWWNISATEFWKTIESYGWRFWRDLDVLDEGLELYKYLVDEYGINNIVFCSTPSLDPNCSKGKVKWLYKHIGKGFRNYIFTPRKEVLAQTGWVLIDDCNTNVEKFRNVGGVAILYPQDWNENRCIKQKKLEYVTDMIGGVRWLKSML